jgi:enamine deaminase RidA (YjgF/YER057c/UK114 family)
VLVPTRRSSTRSANWDVLRIVAEPGGATALAALLSRAVPREGERIAVIICGANTDAVSWGQTHPRPPSGVRPQEESMSGLFVPSVETEPRFVSGHIAKRNGQPWVGRLGETMTTAEGQQAARAVAEDLLRTLGDLSRVKRIVKVMVLVNSAPDFTDSTRRERRVELLIER